MQLRQRLVGVALATTQARATLEHEGGNLICTEIPSKRNPSRGCRQQSLQ